jgi:hypothetical protein
VRTGLEQGRPHSGPYKTPVYGLDGTPQSKEL